MKFNKEKILQPNTVIHCETEEQAKELLAWADSIGRKWCEEDSYIENTMWSDYVENTCYYLYKNEFSPFNFYKEEGYTIYEFEDVVVTDANLISMDKKYKTREGKDVRIICTDTKDEHYSVIALVSHDENTEEVCLYNKKGTYYYSGMPHNYDLIEVKPIPDKALIRCWDDDFTFTKHEKFYDAVYERTFSSKGKRKGVFYDHYEIIDPEPKWSIEARKHLED